MAAAGGDAASAAATLAFLAGAGAASVALRRRGTATAARRAAAAAGAAGGAGAGPTVPVTPLVLPVGAPQLRLCIATCQDLVSGVGTKEVEERYAGAAFDDGFLYDALKRRGVDFDVSA